MEVNKVIYPSGLLSRYVKYYWVLKTKNINPIHVIPVGLPQLAFYRGNEIKLISNDKAIPKAYIRGQFLESHDLILNGEIDLFVVVFNSHGINQFLSSPATDFHNGYISVYDLANTQLNHLANILLSELDDSKRIRFVEYFLKMHFFIRNKYNTERIDYSIHKIKSCPEVDIMSLAQDVCLGYRHFKRIFTEYVGINPKKYSKIIRFQKSLYIQQNRPQIEITQLAHECGYYDHSHLIKDYKSLSGYNPTEFRMTQHPYSTYYSQDCKINYIT